MQTIEEVSQRARVAERMAQALVHEVWFEEDCEVTGFSGEGRCIEPAVAIRWEHGFMDRVCQEHATRAQNRGALVVSPRKQDGTNARNEPIWGGQ